MRPSLFALAVTGLLFGCSSGSGDPSYVNRSGLTSSSAFASTPLGITGSGGATEELLGTDILTPLVGSGGLVGATLGGGSDGPLAGNIPSGGLVPAGALSPVTDALGQLEAAVPGIGVSGEDGLGEDLLGHDITGMLLGTEVGFVPVLLAGGNEAPLGGLAPEDAAPLAPVGDLVSGIIIGAQADASQGNLNALEPLIGPLILGVLGAGGEGAGPIPGVALPELPTEQLSPILGPVSVLTLQVLATPLLPNGTTANEIVFPVALGGVAGIAGAALPLGTIAETLAGAMP